MNSALRAVLIASTLAPACARTHEGLSNAVRLGAAGRSASTTDQAAGQPGRSAGAGHAEVKTGNGGADLRPSAASGSRDAANAERDAADVASAADVSNDATIDGVMKEVWVGQVWSVAPALCDWTAPWSDTPVVVQPMGYVERAVLTLEHAGSAQLTGRIRLGEGAPPASPGDAPYASSDSGSYWLCSIQLPTKGVEYDLLNARQTSDRLMFEVSASQVWDTWCHGQSSRCPGGPCPMGPICTCDEGGCRAAEHDHLAFDLSVTADSIEGQLPFGSGFGTRADIRLHRAQ